MFKEVEIYFLSNGHIFVQFQVLSEIMVPTILFFISLVQVFLKTRGKFKELANKTIEIVISIQVSPHS